MESLFDYKGHPKVRVTVHGQKRSINLEAILDTGFDGFLSLPISTAVQLGLELVGTDIAEYADGRKAKELKFAATVSINGKDYLASITLTESSQALAGTRLFVDSKVILDFPTRKISITRSKT